MIDKDFDIKINALYREMELDLIRSMKRNFALHTAEEQKYGFDYPQWQAIKLKELRRYQRQNGRIIKGATARIPKDISKHMQKELQTGRKSEMKRFKEAFGDKYTQSVNLKDSFFRLNDRKVNALIDAVNDSLHTANTAALRMANDVYRDVIFRTGFFLSNGVKTPQQAIDMATKDFLARGINCIEYKDGRRVNIADYASMAVRTANQRAYLIGEGERRQQMGVPFIRISRHGTSCELCKPFERKVLIDDVYSGGKQEDGDYMLLSKAMELGLFHPRCRHGTATFFPDMEEEFNELGLEYTDSRVNEYGDKAINEAHIENMIQRYKRLSLGSLDPENIKHYEERLSYWQGRKGEVEENINVDKIIEKGVLYSKNEELVEFTLAKDVHYIGKLNKEIYSCVTKDIVTDDVIITDERINHIKVRHPNDFEMYCNFLKEAIEHPDYIIEANKNNKNSAVILKSFKVKDKYFKIIIRLVTSTDNINFKNSVITFMKIDERDYKRLIKNKKILYKSE